MMIVLLMLIGVVTAISGCGQPDTPIAEAQPRRGTTTPELPADALLPGDEQVLEAIRGDLARPNLDPATRQGLEEKLAFEEHVIRERATALAVPTAIQDLNAPVPTEPLPEMPGPSVVTPLPDGGAIVDSGNYVTSRYLMENSWYYDQETTRVVVWAGADNPEGPKPDPRQGILLVEERRLVDADETWQTSAPPRIYSTPDRAGRHVSSRHRGCG